MNKPRLLLHICCAPDATVPWSALINEDYYTAGYFYGSNIHPEEEYFLRREAVEILSKKTMADYFISDYMPEKWFDFVRGLENEHEGGARCAKCFEAQFKSAAEFAAENGFSHLCTTLTISPHKNVKLINDLGTKIAKAYGLIWLERVWRKSNGFKKSVEASKALGLYRQNYCGCIFSKEENDNFRTAHTKEAIKT